MITMSRIDKFVSLRNQVNTDWRKAAEETIEDANSVRHAAIMPIKYGITVSARVFLTILASDSRDKALVDLVESIAKKAGMQEDIARIEINSSAYPDIPLYLFVSNFMRVTQDRPLYVAYLASKKTTIGLTELFNGLEE